MSGAMDKDVAKMAKELRAQGWTVELTRKGHIRWTSPKGAVVITGGHPNPATLRRMKGQLARAMGKKQK